MEAEMEHQVTFNASTATGDSGRKSTFSTENGNCVLVDIQGDHVLVKDSKDPDSPILRFTRDEYVAFWKA